MRILCLFCCSYYFFRYGYIKIRLATINIFYTNTQPFFLTFIQNLSWLLADPQIFTRTVYSCGSPGEVYLVNRKTRTVPFALTIFCKNIYKKLFVKKIVLPKAKMSVKKFPDLLPEKNPLYFDLFTMARVLRFFCKSGLLIGR